VRSDKGAPRDPCTLLFVGVLGLALFLSACDDKNDPPAPSRFESVKKKPAAAQSFCEKTFAPGEKKLTLPPLRGDKPAAVTGWTWLNLWATWCTPCVEEMGLLNRWREAAEHEGLPLHFELLSIDESDAEPKLNAWKAKNLPGPILWLRSQDDLAPFLEGVGVDKGAAIPIHILVDPSGSVRCVRVGAIHEENWGAVKSVMGT
jgi:thiol-disulfide isomerase/thioredoxin